MCAFGHQLVEDMKLIIDNRQAENRPFERRQTGLILPADTGGLLCRLHITRFDSRNQRNP